MPTAWPRHLLTSQCSPFRIPPMQHVVKTTQPASIPKGQLLNGLARWRCGGDGMALANRNTELTPNVFTHAQGLSVWVGARQTHESRVGPGVDTQACRQKTAKRSPLTPESRRR